MTSTPLLLLAAASAVVIARSVVGILWIARCRRVFDRGGAGSVQRLVADSRWPRLLR